MRFRNFLRIFGRRKSNHSTPRPLRHPPLNANKPRMNRRRALMIIAKVGIAVASVGLLTKSVRVQKNHLHRVNQMISNWPEIRSKGMMWVKYQGSGKWVDPGFKREFQSEGNPGDLRNLKGVRKTLHTHAYTEPIQKGIGLEGTHEKFRHTPSVSDFDAIYVGDLIGHETGKEKFDPKKNYFIQNHHVAILNQQGNPMGYITIHVSKKALQNPMEFLKKYYPLSEELSQAEHSMTQIFERSNPIQAYREAYQEYHTVIEKLREIGIRMRYTPNKKEGFTFRDGIFQKN